MTKKGKGGALIDNKKKYTTVLGDTWDIISNKLYKNSLFQDKLIALNQQYVDVPFFSAGIELIYEEIEQVEYPVTAPWRRI